MTLTLSLIVFAVFVLIGTALAVALVRAGRQRDEWLKEEYDRRGLKEYGEYTGHITADREWTGI